MVTESNFLNSVETSHKGNKPHLSFFITGVLIHILASDMLFTYLGFPMIANHAGNEPNSVG